MVELYFILLILIVIIIVLFQEVWKIKKAHRGEINEYSDKINKEIQELESQYNEKIKLIKEDFSIKQLTLKEQHENSIKQMELEKTQTIDSLQEVIDSNNNFIKQQEQHKKDLIENQKEQIRSEIKTFKSNEIEKINIYITNFKNSELSKMNSFIEEEKNKSKQKIEDFLSQENSIKEELQEYKLKRDVINKAILREREIEEKENFYRLNIPESDQYDIEVLKEISPKLQNQEVLNKLIFETFIRRPFNEMVKRVLKNEDISGIYKITYTKTGEAYIGRSVHIKDRWKQHLLSSLNIGTIAHSSFHNILANKGVWNFTWEVLEQVEKDKLNEREKYWIDFYGTNKQFNEKAGG